MKTAAPTRVKSVCFKICQIVQNILLTLLEIWSRTTRWKTQRNWSVCTAVSIRQLCWGSDLKMTTWQVQMPLYGNSSVAFCRSFQEISFFLHETWACVVLVSFLYLLLKCCYISLCVTVLYYFNRCINLSFVKTDVRTTLHTMTSVFP